MLPKISDKTQAKDVIPYHSFAREIMSRRISQNNISKLKLIKEFLEDQQFQCKVEQRNLRIRRVSELESDHGHELDTKGDKENIEKTKKVKRQSLTSEARTNQNRDKTSLDKEKSFIFSVPDRFKLNELLLGPKTRKTVIKDLLNNSLKMNSQLYTHRIL